MINLFKNKQEYTLMHRDIPVLTGIYSFSSHSFKEIYVVHNEDHLPIGSRVNGTFSLKAFNHWYRWRGIPDYRVGLLQLENRLNIESPIELLDEEHALSVSDTYWIKGNNEKITWGQVNFFQHSYDQQGFAKAMFSTFNIQADDSSKHTPNNCLCGYHRKAWMKRNGTLYLLKGGSPFHQQEPVNEWLASRIAQELGLNAITYTTETYENNLVSVCPNMCDGKTDLVTAEYILQETNAPTDLFQYSHYVKVLEDKGLQNVRKTLSDQFVLDYLLMNTDRHTQNMGILVDSTTNEYKSMAPLFDTGTGLGCLVKDEEILDEKNHKKCQLLNAKHFSHDALLKFIDYKQYDFSSLTKLPQEYGNQLVKYQSLTNISNERIENAYTLFYKQILSLKKAAK